MTLKLEGDLHILKMYLHTENEAASLRHSKLRDLARSKCQKLRIILSVIVTDIPIKPQQFPTNSFELHAIAFSLL